MVYACFDKDMHWLSSMYILYILHSLHKFTLVVGTWFDKECLISSPTEDSVLPHFSLSTCIQVQLVSTESLAQGTTQSKPDAQTERKPSILSVAFKSLCLCSRPRHSLWYLLPSHCTYNIPSLCITWWENIKGDHTHLVGEIQAVNNWS